jgi:hypothetical protein
MIKSEKDINKKSLAYKIAKYDLHNEVLFLFLAGLGTSTYAFIMFPELSNSNDSLDLPAFIFIMLCAFTMLFIAGLSIRRKLVYYHKKD